MEGRRWVGGIGGEEVRADIVLPVCGMTMRGGEVKEMEDSTCAMMAPGCEEQARMLACSEKGIHSPQEAPQSV